MMRRTLSLLDKLIIVESPNKVIKIEGLLSDPQCIPDWSFKSPELRSIGSGPEKVHAVATAGHFMGLTEINWEPQTPPGSSSRVMAGGKGAHSPQRSGNLEGDESFPINGTLASYSLEWETLPGRKVAETVSRYIDKMGTSLSEIILATDPDREGELIAVHSLNLIQSMYPSLTVPFSRAYIHSITEDGVQKAMKDRQVQFCDFDLANAAETRHAMDRMFGYLGSSVMRAANQQMRSIGRVQTPALILVNERENKIAKFNADRKSTFVVEATCTFPTRSGSQTTFSQRVSIEPDTSKDGEDGARGTRDCTSAEEAQAIGDGWNLEAGRNFVVHPGGMSIVPATVPPPRPFTMATLIAHANRQLHMSSESVSSTLQDLFQLGFITYPRTDSSRIDPSALEKIYEAIRNEYGDAALYTAEDRAAEEEKAAAADDDNANGRKRGGSSATKKKQKKESASEDMNVEDAHEAIRPTDITMSGDALSLNRDSKQLYELIRSQTHAAFMLPMKTERVAATVSFVGGDGTHLCFKLGGKKTVEAGWTAATKAAKKRASNGASAAAEEEDADELGALPEGESDAMFVEKNGVRQAIVQNISSDEFQSIISLASTLKGSARGGPIIKLRSPAVSECCAVAPLPLSEGTLIEALKDHGVGRPSTYPTIVRTLLLRNYIVVNGKGRCETTQLGRQVVSTAQSTFPSLIDIGFTASFEKKLDIVAKPTNAPLPAMVRGTNLSHADYVLSHFFSTLLMYITEATRLQRTQIIEKTMKLRHEQRKQEEEELNFESSGDAEKTSSVNSMTDEDFEKALEEAKEKVAQSVPDFSILTKGQTNFSALQRSLYDYLKKNFPPVQLNVVQSGSGVSLREHSIPTPKPLSRRQVVVRKKRK